MGRWYVEHLGFKVTRRIVEPPYTHFLVDETGLVMIEIYGNADAPVPDYAAQHPLTLHLALVSTDVPSDVRRLESAGAQLDGAIVDTPAGDRMAMLRDPWGCVLQLVQRKSPML